MTIRVDSKQFTDKESGKERLVLKDVRLQLNNGEFVAIVGPSGCGKSTLLHIVAGLDQSYRGEITWDWSGNQRSHRLGYVFQNPRLLPWLRVRSNIELVMEKPASDSALVDSLLAATGLQEFSHFYPGQLSLGMQRRVALVRAFAIKPCLLLMDEPFVSLDQPTANQLRQLLITVWNTHRSSVLFVTHDLHEAVTLADRIAFLATSPARVICEVNVAIPRHQRDRADLTALRFGELQKLFDDLYAEDSVAQLAPC